MRYKGHLLYPAGRYRPGATPASRKSVCLVCLWFEIPKGILMLSGTYIDLICWKESSFVIFGVLPQSILVIIWPWLCSYPRPMSSSVPHRLYLFSCTKGRNHLWKRSRTSRGWHYIIESVKKRGRRTATSGFRLSWRVSTQIAWKPSSELSKVKHIRSLDFFLSV